MNGVSRSALALIAAVLLLGLVRDAVAQSLSPYRRYNSSLFVNGNLRPSFQRQWRAANLRREGKGASELEPGVAPVALPLSASSFRPVGEPIMPKRLAARFTELDDTQRRALETALVELLKSYEQLLERNEDSQLKNNLAGAFAFLFRSSYRALKGGQELTAEQRAFMLEQINDSIGMGLKERRMSDREKQELYESVVLSGSIILGLYDEGQDKGQREQVRSAQELAKDLLDQMMGIAIDKVRPTEDGVHIELARG